MAYLLTQRAICNSLSDDRRPYNWWFDKTFGNWVVGHGQERCVMIDDSTTGGLIKPSATGSSVMVKNRCLCCRRRKKGTWWASRNFDLVVRISYCDRFFFAMNLLGTTKWILYKFHTVWYFLIVEFLRWMSWSKGSWDTLTEYGLII
jgi:hypothetical protein